MGLHRRRDRATRQRPPMDDGSAPALHREVHNDQRRLPSTATSRDEDAKKIVKAGNAATKSDMAVAVHRLASGDTVVTFRDSTSRPNVEETKWVQTAFEPTQKSTAASSVWSSTASPFVYPRTRTLQHRLPSNDSGIVWTTARSEAERLRNADPPHHRCRQRRRSQPNMPLRCQCHTTRINLRQSRTMKRSAHGSATPAMKSDIQPYFARFCNATARPLNTR